jgi:hypothetical protein
MASAASPGALRCRKKFLRFFKGGFFDDTYIDWERGYKWAAHEQWEKAFGRSRFRALLAAAEYEEAAARAIRIESRTNLLFSFEKMALRDAVKSPDGARAFSEGLHDFLYKAGEPKRKFEKWCETVGALPRKQTRVLTWPLGHGVRLYRATRNAYPPQAERHPHCGARIWVRFPLHVPSIVGHVSESARIRRGRAARRS